MKWQMTERRHLQRNGFNKAQLIVILGLLPIHVQVCVIKDTDCCQLVYHTVMSMIKTFRACMVVMTPNIKRSRFIAINARMGNSSSCIRIYVPLHALSSIIRLWSVDQ